MGEAAEDELAERDWHFGVDVVGRLHGQFFIELIAQGFIGRAAAEGFVVGE